MGKKLDWYRQGWGAFTDAHTFTCRAQIGREAVSLELAPERVGTTAVANGIASMHDFTDVAFQWDGHATGTVSGEGLALSFVLQFGCVTDVVARWKVGGKKRRHTFPACGCGG